MEKHYFSKTKGDIPLKEDTLEARYNDPKKYTIHRNLDFVQHLQEQ